MVRSYTASVTLNFSYCQPYHDCATPSVVECVPYADPRN